MYKMSDPNKSKGKEHYGLYEQKVKDVIDTFINPSPLTGVVKVKAGTYANKFLTEVRNNQNDILKTLLMGTFTEQKALIDHIEKELNKWEKKKPGTRAYFHSILKSVFVDEMYEKTTVFDKNDHVKRVDNEICPYCGRSYIYFADHPTKSNPNTMVKPCIDHFLPKDQYPYLAMCYYNLIPSCTGCNNSPCKWTNNPIGDDRTHEYLMHPYEFDSSKIKFSYVATPKVYDKNSVKVRMDCDNKDLDEGYKKWLNLDQFYGKHNGEVCKMYVQMVELQKCYRLFTQNNLHVPVDFIAKIPEMVFGYQLSDERAQSELMYKFRSEVYAQMEKSIKL